MPTTATNGSVPVIRSVEPQKSGSGVILFGRTLFNRGDYNPNLNGQSGTAKYERMRRDPAIAGHLFRWKSHLEAANWTFEPPEKGSKKAIDAMMELCNRYIMGEGRNRVEDTFKGGLLPHILLKLDFGCSAIEKVWGINEKGQQVYARLAPILPSSIFEFELGDLGECARIVQYAWVIATGTFKKVTIPDPIEAPGVTAEDKIAVFTYRKEGDNYFGRPILRECFHPWFHKDELWFLDGAQKERSGMGMTVIKIPSTITDTSDPIYVAAQKVAFEMRGNERNGAVIGEDWELEQKYPTGTEPDILGSMEFCNRQIAAAFNDQQSQYGTTPNGTKALGETQTETSMLGDQALADEIEQEVNTQLVQPLIKRNLGPQEEYPKLQCEDLDKMTGPMQATIVKMLLDSGAMKADRKLEEHLRKNMDFPKIDDATREEPLPPQIVTPVGVADPNATDPIKPPAAKPAAPAAKAASPEAYTGLRRDPMPHEAHADFIGMQRYLDEEPLRIWARAVAPLRGGIIQAIASKVANMTDAELRSAPPPRNFFGKLADSVYPHLLVTYMKGRRSLLEERARQLAMKAEVEEDDDIEPTASQKSWVRSLAGLFATGFLGVMGVEAVRVAGNARNAEQAKTDERRTIERALEALSIPRQQQGLAGRVTQAFTNGRNEQADAMKGDIATAYYTAMMDSATCDVCAPLDGAEHEPGDETYATPNPACLGGENCRCETIYVFREVTQQEAA